MKQLVILPGGFHPYHAGHYSLYQSAVQAFPDADVYVAATADTSKRPFPFEIKQKLARLAGVPADRFVQVQSPFRAQEITSHYDPEDTQLIFVRSDKDRDSGPKPGGVKKDGTPSYLQPYSNKEQLPLTQRGYMAYLPTVEFGPGMKSATEIRNAWPELNDKRKLALVMSLYPKTQKNTKLAKNVVKMLDSVLSQPVDENQGWAATLETTLVNDPQQGIQLRPQGGFGTWSEKSLVSRLQQTFDRLQEMLSSGRYNELHDYLRGDTPTLAMVKALSDLESFRRRQGRRPLARGREIDIGEDGQTAGTPAVGGMHATYQARENQPPGDYVEEKWSMKYKRSIDCDHPRGFSQKAHCAGRKKS